MYDTLPKDATVALEWSFDKFQPYLDALLERDLSADNVDAWMADWSSIAKLMNEVVIRLQVATTQNTEDEAIEARFNAFMENIYPQAMTYTNKLNHKLLDSGLQPENFAVPLRNMRADAELFREENLVLETQKSKLDIEFDKLMGAQTVEWEGEERTLPQMSPILLEQDRARREKAWRLMVDRNLQDRDALNDLWVRYMDLRGQIAANADMPDYRAYQWKAMQRFDYSPQDAETFQRAIEAVAVPAAQRIREKKRSRLGVDSLRPWDTMVDPDGKPPLKPYESTSDLIEGMTTMFSGVDPALGAYFQTMRNEDLLDLENRKGKAPGGYCTDLPLAKRPFIFMNSVGLHDDVQTLLHEGGHAFHAFEALKLPYVQQQNPPMEFAEVASMSMELLGAPYLTKAQGGFYDEADAARARLDHLETSIMFWPYMAVVDAFQHWVYTNHKAATDPANCDAKWGELWDRFMPGIDYSGLEDVRVTGWHRKLHIFQIPFYYIEYGLAQLGAVQVWGNSLTDQAGAIQSYLNALALGGTATLPALFQTAGAKFGFDADTLKQAVDLMETTIESLDAVS
ncbi:MAG: M3 family oligoendopeptidase [Aggregatilineales bacterium]